MIVMSDLERDLRSTHLIEEITQLRKQLQECLETRDQLQKEVDRLKSQTTKEGKPEKPQTVDSMSRDRGF